MCKGNYSCTINEATNLESAFVIAHEIGHSLGVMHDGQRNNCDPNGYIMSEKTGAGKVHWSRCSNHYLNESINRGQLGCLDVEQSGAKESMYDLDKLRPPGQVYSVGDQCKLAFGANYTSFVTRQQPFNVSASTFLARRLKSATSCRRRRLRRHCTCFLDNLDTLIIIECSTELAINTFALPIRPFVGSSGAFPAPGPRLHTLL